MSYIVTDLVWTQERLGPPPHQGTSFIYMTNRGQIGVGVLVWELWSQSPTPPHEHNCLCRVTLVLHSFGAFYFALFIQYSFVLGSCRVGEAIFDGLFYPVVL